MRDTVAFAAALGLAAGAVLAADTKAPGMVCKPLPDKVVVLTFDDAISSHYSVVAPILKEYGFGGTFYICEFPPDFEKDKVKYLTWEQIAALDKMGFEIANHTRTHANIDRLTAEEINAELSAIDEKCKAHGIPRPVGFAYPSYKLSEKALPIFQERGYQFVRAGGSRCYDPTADHPYLVPSFSTSGGDEQKVLGFLKQAAPGKIVVLTLHGVPDLAHAWVNTPPELFKNYMRFLKENNYTVIAMRDLSRYIDAKKAMAALAPEWDKQFIQK